MSDGYGRGPLPWMGQGVRPGQMEWQPIETAPRDRAILVWATGAHDLEPIMCTCKWHPDAGFCVDELREPTHWMPLPNPPTDESAN